MQELVQFVSGAMIGGVVGNTTYDGLKIILGSSFDRLSNYLLNNEIIKFEVALDMLFEENKELKTEIEQLQQGKSVVSDNSIKVGGNNSGNIVTGNNNTIHK